MQAVELASASIVDLLKGFREQSWTPVDALDGVAAQIDQWNPILNAYNVLDVDRARDLAEASAQRWAKGEPQGVLDGVPIAIKDTLLTAGWPTRRGSTRISADALWREDAPSVARLREQGAIFPGKTTTPELGWKATTDSPLTGVTRNPWNPSVTPGGSSGGSAAAVATGAAAAALGTDAGGSVRIPAAFCNLVGLKPTYGRIPQYPDSTFGTLANVGPITRTVADAALLMEVLAASDDRDWLRLPPYQTELSAALELTGLKVGFSPDFGYAAVEPDVAQLVDTAVTKLSDQGASVEVVNPGFRDPIDAFEILWAAGCALGVDALGSTDGVDPGLVGMASKGATLSALDHARALLHRGRVARAVDNLLSDCDVIVTPAVAVAPFEAGRNCPPGSRDSRWFAWTPFSFPFNMTHHPAISVPCGFTPEGLPVGLQIVGPRFREDLVMAVAGAYEQLDPHHAERPPMPQGPP